MQRSRPVILQGIEPGLADRGPGRIIFLSGASSSATSTLAAAMQQVSGELFLHVSPDHLVASGMLPGRRDPDGPFAWWDQMRPRFFAGFAQVPSRAGCGGKRPDRRAHHRVPCLREDLARLLEGLGDFLACVCCDLAEISRRGRGRGYRRIGEVCPLSGASEEPGR